MTDKAEEGAPEIVYYFLTVRYCNQGPRGVFCNSTGGCFRKDNEPHTSREMDDILGPFALILSPESTVLTREELAEYTRWGALAEYSNDYGIAVKLEDVPQRDAGEAEDVPTT